MNFSKKILFILSLALLQTASTLASAGGRTPQMIYNRLSGGLSVELTSADGPLVGAAIMQKSNPSGHPAFCRRTNPVVPNPTYTYECFYETFSGADAEALYSGSNAIELNATFRDPASGSVLLGSSWTEKHIGSSEAAICVKTAPVVPNPIATYHCYSNHGPVGGAVSGGN